MTCPEPDKTVAQARFQQCISLCNQIISAERAWSTLGKLLTAMDSDSDFQKIGYSSMGRMLMEIELLTGYSRASCYHYKALYEQAFKHAGENIHDMRLGSAEAFVTLPEHLQRDERVQMAASESPEKFEEHIRTQHPEALWEKPHILKLPSSRWEVIKSAIEYYRQVEADQELTDQECLEFLSSDWKALRMSLEEIAKNSSELV